MDFVQKWIVFAMFFVLLTMVNSETEEAKRALIQFMNNISPGNSWGWNLASDPCNTTTSWKGVDCLGSQSVKKIILDQLNLTGVFDAGSLCLARSLQVISLNDNKVTGELPQEISKCSHLTHLYLQRNNFSGNVPASLPKLGNLKRLAISNNAFSGELPDFSRISGLLTFLAENNKLSGTIPEFKFSNLQDFNVSNNNFSGPIPTVDRQFPTTSFLGNPGLCGEPLSNPCQAPPTQESSKKKNGSKKQYFIYSGYAAIGLVIILLVVFKAIKTRKPKETNNVKKSDSTSSKPSSVSSEFKNGGNRSEYSITSPDHPKTSASLIVLSSPVVNGLKFEDLLKAPAELVGRGKNGTLYKVTLNSGINLAVKRIKDWELSRDEFKNRMQMIDQVKHKNVLPVIAYYCSQQEKLLVYEFHHNGSLFKLLHGKSFSSPFPNS